jgi:hypothetical protein
MMPVNLTSDDEVTHRAVIQIATWWGQVHSAIEPDLTRRTILTECGSLLLLAIARFALVNGRPVSVVLRELVILGLEGCCTTLRSSGDAVVHHALLGFAGEASEIGDVQRSRVATWSWTRVNSDASFDARLNAVNRAGAGDLL